MKPILQLYIPKIFFPLIFSDLSHLTCGSHVQTINDVLNVFKTYMSTHTE